VQLKEAEVNVAVTLHMMCICLCELLSSGVDFHGHTRAKMKQDACELLVHNGNHASAHARSCWAEFIRGPYSSFRHALPVQPKKCRHVELCGSCRVDPETSSKDPRTPYSSYLAEPVVCTQGPRQTAWLRASMHYGSSMESVAMVASLNADDSWCII